MVAEPTTTTYSDTLITGIIERYPLLDINGVSPTDGAGDTINADWLETYNLNYAAADIWTEKAAAVAVSFDFKAGQGSFTQSQLQAQYLKMAETYRTKRLVTSRPIP